MLSAVFKKYRELWYALAAIAVTTAAYVVIYRRLGSLPPARGLAGHGIGILGFVLMLMTETLYTLRKRSTRARWGRMSSWLRFHMVTGLVGSYMVLLHPAMRFRGLAGIVTLFTVVVVISGLVGRYLYTVVPRAIDGTELEASEIEAQLARAESASARSGPSERSEGPAGGGMLLAAETIPAVTAPVAALTQRRHVLDRQLRRLTTARRALATWRAFHVPITLILFISAFAHIGGAIYYATLLH